MSPLLDFRFTKLLIFLYLPLLLLCVFSSTSAAQTQTLALTTSARKLLDLQNQENQSKNKTKPTSTSSTKNQTKLIKPVNLSTSTKNQIKLITTSNSNSSSPNNKTKLIKPISNSNNKTKPISNSNAHTTKIQLNKLNSTSKPSNSTKKSSDLASKTTKPIPNQPKPKTIQKKVVEKTKIQKPKNPTWIDEDEEEEEDLVSDFRDLPFRFQETLLPDLERFSTNSKVYITQANKDLTNGFKPLVGKKYAPAIASVVSCAFILIPLILVSLIFNQIKAYFSLQKIIIFIQIYLAIYFTILCLSALVTGLEPLRFFYATSRSTYICIQVLQTLGYVLYLLLLLMYLVLVFSTETGLVSKLLGLGQTFVGFAVGLHYYVTVFHRAVLHQQPKSSWKIHALYATCFLVICVLDRLERRKKAYLEEGGAEGKKS